MNSTQKVVFFCQLVHFYTKFHVIGIVLNTFFLPKRDFQVIRYFHILSQSCLITIDLCRALELQVVTES